MDKICNDCRYLSITEEEQNRLRGLGVEKIHICNKFGKRVYHRSTGKYHDVNIYPCEECKMNDNIEVLENYKDYMLIAEYTENGITRVEIEASPLLDRAIKYAILALKGE